MIESHIDDLIDVVVPDSIDGGDFLTATTRWPTYFHSLEPIGNEAITTYFEHFLYTSTPLADLIGVRF